MTTNERRKRERQIISDLGELSKQEDIEIKVEYTKAGLTVQGQPYRKMILPPTPKELISLSLQELDKILKIPMTRGQEVRQDNSMFTAYTAEVSTHQQIREMYMRIKLAKPEARHIVCAYIIPGQHHTSRDFQEDGELGAGRALLQFMELNQLKNRVIFVVRFYGGIKIGASRFTCYKQAAMNAVQKVCDQNLVMYAPRKEQHRQPTVQENAAEQNTSRDNQSQNYQSGQVRPYYRGRGGRGSAASVRRPVYTTQQYRSSGRASRYEEIMKENMDYLSRLMPHTSQSLQPNFMNSMNYPNEQLRRTQRTSLV